MTILSLLICAPAFAKEPAFTPARTDKLAAQALEAWSRQSYHLGRAGVRSASFRIHGAIIRPGARPRSATGSYRWDLNRSADRSRLSWADPAIGRMFAAQGWRREIFDNFFDPLAEQKSLAGCRLTGRRVGDQTHVAIEGQTPCKLQGFVFDKGGVLTRMIIGLPGRGTQPVSMPFTMHYRKAGKWYLGAGWSNRMGSVVLTVRMTHRSVGGLHLIDRIVSTAKNGERTLCTSVMRFVDYTINGRRVHNGPVEDATPSYRSIQR